MSYPFPACPVHGIGCKIRLAAAQALDQDLSELAEEQAPGVWSSDTWEPDVDLYIPDCSLAAVQAMYVLYGGS